MSLEVPVQFRPLGHGTGSLIRRCGSPGRTKVFVAAHVGDRPKTPNNENARSNKENQVSVRVVNT